MYTGFVQRGLPRSSPKNAAAPLYKERLRMLVSVHGPSGGSSIPFADEPSKLLLYGKVQRGALLLLRVLGLVAVIEVMLWQMHC